MLGGWGWGEATPQGQCSLFGVVPITQSGLCHVWDDVGVACHPLPVKASFWSSCSATSDFPPMCVLGRGLWKKRGCGVVLTGPPIHLRPLALIPEETSLKSRRATRPRWWSGPRGGRKATEVSTVGEAGLRRDLRMSRPMYLCRSISRVTSRAEKHV